MKSKAHTDGGIAAAPQDESAVRASIWGFAGMALLLWLGVIWAAGPWAGRHAVLLGGTALLMLMFPPAVRLPRGWWIAAAGFLFAGCLAFLPAAMVSSPAWRAPLGAAGLETGGLVAIQPQFAIESLALFAITLLGGLWLAGHRPSPAGLRVLALVFVSGVAAYALLARIMADDPSRHYGFFPNRNHTGTYLAMGSVCGLGCIIQAIRDRHIPTIAIALVATTICLWAVAAWSISRAGVVLTAIGCLLWLMMLGRSYLDRHGWWAVTLILLTAGGLFLIADSGVKQRLTDTIDRAAAIRAAADGSAPDIDDRPASTTTTRDLDFRIPIALDALAMIRDHPWTGVGAGHFADVFPQYRRLTAVANDSDALHPESDWLWMAAETGLPATLALAALVALAGIHGWLGLRRGRDRSLRAACLVAAFIVPIHGIFDVPGHRIPLAWSAAWLFALSLRATPLSHPSPRQRRWPSRAVAMIVLTAATWLAVEHRFATPKTALTAVENTTRHIMELHRQDIALQEAAAAEGRTYDPDPEDDLLEVALAMLGPARQLRPMNRELLRLESSLALQFIDKYDIAIQAHYLERALDPSWIGAPLRHAAEWAHADPEHSARMWDEALQRAAQLDQWRNSPDQPHQARDRTIARIRQQARQFPVLESKIPAIANPDAPAD